MAMTPGERHLKDVIIRLLRQQGYATYSRLLNELDVKVTDRPDVIAYLDVNKGRIVVNKGLYKEQISTVIRHEILHDFLKHHLRLVNQVSDELGIDLDSLDGDERRKAEDEIHRSIYSNKLYNIAGDYEISNRGYTDEDKRIIRKIRLDDKTLSGLVTEDQHPEWVDLSLEELYNELRKEANQLPQPPQQGDGDPDDNQDDNNTDSNGDGDDNDEQGQEIIHGSLKDLNTFVDANGNPVIPR